MSDYSQPQTMEGNSNQTQTLTLNLEHQSPTHNPNSSSDPHSQEWEAKARVWLSALPDQTNVTLDQFESWINSNQVPLPQQLQSVSPSQLYEKILSFSEITRPQFNQVKPSSHHPARFQRTDQWIPVYAWLETLDRNEVVKSKEIADWLSENPDVKEKLYSKHSRYHLMHYIQKCHMKILKRQGKLQKAAQPSEKVPTKALNNGVLTVAVSHPGTSSSSLLKNKDVSSVKRTDAFQRYQLFTELENLLSTLLPKQDKQTA